MRFDGRLPTWYKRKKLNHRLGATTPLRGCAGVSCLFGRWMERTMERRWDPLMLWDDSGAAPPGEPRTRVEPNRRDEPTESDETGGAQNGFEDRT